MKYYKPQKVDYAPYLIFHCVAKDDEDLAHRGITNAIAETDLPSVVGGICVKALDAEGNLIDRDSKVIEAGMLSEAKAKKLNEINAYDESDEVNSFTYAGISMWVGRDARHAIINGINAEKALNKTETIITLPTGTQITIPIDKALQLLYAIEYYAKDCYNVTVSHRNAVSNLTSVKSVEGYNFKVRYPERLKLEEVKTASL